MFPADELFELRSEIKRLKEREAVLRSRMLADPGGPSCAGRVWEGIVVSRECRRLDLRALPAPILVDPAYFQTSGFRAVLLRPVGNQGRAERTLSQGLRAAL
ncbi:MAG: hypothetical protein AAFR79_03020 [Pseudomonadota bacterium]